MCRGSVAKHGLGLLVASKSIEQLTYCEALVRLIHVNAEVLPDGVVCSRTLTPAKLMLDSPDAVGARWSCQLGIASSQCIMSSATVSDALRIPAYAPAYSTTVGRVRVRTTANSQGG